MAEVLLFHHAQGLTSGVREFADELRDSGHTVHLPDLYGGRVFDDLDAGAAFAQSEGFETLLARAHAAAEGLPEGIVYAGFSLGVLAAQSLAQSRRGASGALLFDACVPVSEFGSAWPAGVPVQIHGMDADEFFAGEGDIDAARDLVRSTPDGELFVYPGDGHLFADPSAAGFDEAAAALLRARALAFLDGVAGGRAAPRDIRAEAERLGGEREQLLGFLDFQRQTLQWKCAGLNATRLASAAVPTSDLSLLGIVRHVTEVEAGWFEGFDGSEATEDYATAADRDAAWHVAPGSVTDADCAAAWSAWHRSVETSRRVVEARSLNEVSAPSDWQYTLRWSVIHMIEEYARHNGHADLLREAIDGAVGE